MYHSTPKRESIDTIEVEKEISWILKNIPCKKETKILVNTENELENYLNENYRKRLRPRNKRAMYKV